MAKAAPKKKAAGKPGKGKGKPLTKAQMVAVLAEKTELTKKQVLGVFEALETEIAASLKSGPGVFVIPNLVKITKKAVAAKPAGMKMNPLTKQMMEVKAKPAHEKVAVRALKRLKSVLTD